MEDKTKAHEYLEVLIRYLPAIKSISTNDLREKVAKFEEKGGKTMKTLADMLKQEGWKDGKQEGWKEGRDEISRPVVKNLILKGFSLDEIADIMNVSTTKVREIKKQLNGEISHSRRHRPANSASQSTEHRA